MIRAVVMTRLSKLGVRLFAASHMSANLHSLKGVILGIAWGSIVDTRGLDKSSLIVETSSSRNPDYLLPSSYYSVFSRYNPSKCG